MRRRNQTWSAIDLDEYRAYKAEWSSESSGRAAAGAFTQIDDKRRRRLAITEIEEGEEEYLKELCDESQNSKLSREEISPPPVRFEFGNASFTGVRYK
ncbi:hypothetical protein U1Q18_005914 [Sarracenia purpurea var. burkii]